MADFDGDDRLDIVTNNFNDHPYYSPSGFPDRTCGAQTDGNEQQP